MIQLVKDYIVLEVVAGIRRDIIPLLHGLVGLVVNL